MLFNIFPGIPCPNVTDPVNGSVSAYSGVYEDTITYTCDLGFELDDGTASQTHICNSSGFWNDTAPTCQGISFSILCTYPSMPH